jgi:Flp pilus assembly protein TadD
MNLAANQIERALSDFDKVIALLPADAVEFRCEAFHWRGVAYTACGDLSDASSDFKQAYHLSTDDKKRADCRMHLAMLNGGRDVVDREKSSAPMRSPGK